VSQFKSLEHVVCDDVKVVKVQLLAHFARGIEAAFGVEFHSGSVAVSSLSG
jgi:hypothetical protein